MGKILKYCLYITSGIILSEITYQACRMFYKVFRKKTLNHNAITDCVNIALFSGNSYDCKCNLTANIYKTNCLSKLCGLKNIQICIKLIDLSKKSIYLCIYLITCNEIGNAIIRANKRGVKIFIIADKGAGINPASQIHRFFKDISITFQNSEQSNLMHHKFCLFDVDWIYDNDDKKENIYVGDDKPHVVQQSFNDKEKNVRAVGVHSDDVPVDNIPSETSAKCVYNENKNNMSNYYPNHVNYDMEKSVLEMEKCAVNNVNPLDSVFIPKGGLLLTGSLNWTAQAFFNNYENILITSNNYMINEYQKEFQRLWKNFNQIL